MSSELNERLRAIPSVDRIIDALGGENHRLAADAARRAIEDVRTRLIAGEDVDPTAVLSLARDLLSAGERKRLRRVINATGVIIHTNLGRAPLGPAQVRAVLEVAAGYSNLEFELDGGKRGSRYEHCRHLLASATGAEDGLVVNNNAAAVLVTLAALCSSREVIVSRGELIEIGGEFRLPDVMTAAGVRLVEVGTTNRTHLSDYENAITSETGALLKVHPANYTITGFTAAVSVRELAQRTHHREIPLICDLGSGLLIDPELPGQAEPVVAEVLQQGVDIATFSGDKLLGGAQAGLIVGRADLIKRIARHPLMRAVRVDKMTLAALQETLLAYLEGRERELPLWQMMRAGDDELRERARSIATELQRVGTGTAVKAEVIRVESVTGGGSLPEATLPSWGVEITHPHIGCVEYARRLRRAPDPVVARIDAERVLLDVRTVLPEEDAALVRTLLAALSDD